MAHCLHNADHISSLYYNFLKDVNMQLQRLINISYQEWMVAVSKIRVDIFGGGGARFDDCEGWCLILEGGLGLEQQSRISEARMNLTPPQQLIKFFNAR